MKNDDDDEFPEINCNYVDINAFDYRNKTSNICMFHLNIASLAKNKDEFELF